MTYRVDLIASAQAELRGLPGNVRSRVLKQLHRLGQHPYPSNSRRLSGDLRGIVRVRVGDYRVAYRVLDDESRIRVLAIGHRAKFYDDLARRQTEA